MNHSGNAPRESAQPFGSAWEMYFDGGWEPLPLPPRTKDPVPKGTTGYSGKALPRDKLATANPEGNIALRLPPTVVAIDVDAYKGKGGDRTLAEAGRRWGPLPDAPWSTSREDGESRILFFRVPEGTRLVDQIQFPALGLGGVEVIQHHHRYAVVWPSIHPDTGNTYRWSADEIPDPAALPELPERWLRGLDAGRAEKVDGVAPEDIERILGRIKDGPSCARARELFERYLEQIRDSTNHHGDALKAVLSLLRCGEEGHVGIPSLLVEYRDAFVQEVDRLERVAVAEFDRMVNGPRGLAILAAKPTPGPRCYCASGTGPALNLPDEFWNARPILGHIRQAAHASGDSADVVLGAVLARLSAMVPHTLQLRNRKGVSPLNLFTINLSQSGGGKSSGSRNAKALLPVTSRLDWNNFRDGIPIGSGEGLAEAFMGWATVETDEGKTSRVRKQVRHNAFLVKDEGQELIKAGDRSGSTTGEALRSAYTGDPLGQSNAQSETSRYIPEMSYSMGIVINFQYETVGPLLAQEGGGTPQRFLFLSADDPASPDEMFVAPEHPGPIGNPLDEISNLRNTWVSYPAHTEAEIWRLVKISGGLDSHKPLALAKVSGLLALLDRRTKVDDEDWRLAKLVWATSCAVRDRAVGVQREQSARDSQARLEAEATKVVFVQDAVEEHVRRKVETAARWLVEKLRDNWGGEAARRKIKDSYGSRKKVVPLEEVLQYAADQGWVVDVEGQPVRLGDESPDDQ